MIEDDFSRRYGDLLTGSYDCVDRIVLNAYMSLCHSPGGFRVWWRRWHDGSDDQLGNTHLMRMAGRFSRRVRAFAGAQGIPLVDCGRAIGLPTVTSGSCVFSVPRGQVCRAHRSSITADGRPRRGRL